MLRRLLLSLIALPLFGATVYTDSTLTVANYTIQEGTSNASIAYSNPSGNFQAVRTLTGAGFAGFAAINPTFIYDPSMGVLNSIDISASVSAPSSPWALFILQGGLLYRASVTVLANGTPSRAPLLVCWRRTFSGWT